MALVAIGVAVGDTVVAVHRGTDIAAVAHRAVAIVGLVVVDTCYFLYLCCSVNTCGTKLSIRMPMGMPMMDMKRNNATLIQVRPSHQPIKQK